MGLFDNYTFRCSSLGYIMTDAQGVSPFEQWQKAESDFRSAMSQLALQDDMDSKSYQKASDAVMKADIKRKELVKYKDVPHLSETCKTHLAEIYTTVTTGRKKILKNKFIEKGLLLEEDAITQYCLLNGIFLKKNKERRNNGFIEGEIDLEEEDCVTDTKVNWDIFTFDRTVLKLNKMYMWQCKGYAILWGKQKGKISYNLLNTPEHLIIREEKILLNDWVGTKEEYEEACKELRFNHTYDDLPTERKERSYIVNLEVGDKEKIESRVIECRKFLNNFNFYESQTG